MERLKKVCEETVQFIEELTQVESKKLQAALQNNLDTINECMKKEQALLLKLKGIDKRREALQKELGYEQFSFRQIIDKVPEEERAGMKKIFDTLSEKYRIYQDTSSSAQKALEVNLHKINKKLEEMHVTDPLQSIYKEDGEMIMVKKSFTNRRV